MKRSLVAALFCVIATSACGPVESYPPYDAGPSNDAGPTCDGVCLIPVNPDWIGPELLWVGDEGDAPPSKPPYYYKDFTGHGYQGESLPCKACTCGPTDGSCDLPATVTAAAASCAADGPGVVHTSFDPPASWSGSCTTASTIPAGQLCGGVPCVQSVTIAPSTSTQKGCLPSTSTLESPPPWNRSARSWYTFQGANCGDSTFCAPASPGPEFKRCLRRVGDPATLDCPPGYPNKSFYYADDAPKCSPCACDRPSEALCETPFELFQDGSCTTPLVPSITINSKGSVCVDVPPGSALGSKQANTPLYNPSHCNPSGGAPEGTVFCCMP
jgi:hypothetical protein